METIKEQKAGRFTVKVVQTAEEWRNPRDNDSNIGRMIFLHNRYTLGDEHDFSTPDEVAEWIDGHQHIKLPVYMLDHSGLALNTTGFANPWDSGMLGFIVATKERVRELYGVKYITLGVTQGVIEELKHEVEIYSHYINGDVYEVIVEDEDGDIWDSYILYGYDYEDIFDKMVEQAGTL